MKKVEAMKLDCSACKGEKTMEQTKIPKFSAVLRVIGYIIVIPSLIGVLVSVITLFSVYKNMASAMQSATSEAARAGVAMGSSAGVGAAVILGAVFLVSGFLGWIFLMKRKVYKCSQCGFILDRG